MSDEILGKTIEILTKTGIKKPPLNKKLLSKPPFRYLHDLFSEVIKTTNTFSGLYNDEEMNSENFKDKDSKVLYLTKMIEVLKLATGSSLKANPLKIVAGLDADDTNLMLQAIGKVVTKKIDTSKAIASIVGTQQETPSSSVAPSPAPPAQANIDREETVNNIPAQEAEAEPAPQPEISAPLPVREEEQPVRKPPSAKPKQEASSTKESASGKQTPDKSTRPPPSKAGSAKSTRQLQDDDNQSVDEPQTAPSMAAPQPNPRGRPMSARPPPPKIKSAVALNEEPSSYVPVHIVSKGDDDDEFIVKTVDDAPKASNTDGADLLDGQHGGLVNKILQTKKDLEGKDVADKGEKPLVASSIGTKDITALRNSIQVLCQSTNPLGKTMDYLQEDADAMNTELALWKKENAKYEQLAKEQKKITKETLSPLQDRLANIEKSIQEQLQKISILKGDILNNDAATEKVLKNIASAN